MNPTIRPFRIEISDEQIADLRRASPPRAGRSRRRPASPTGRT
jgi:hypothetical protein